MVVALVAVAYVMPTSVWERLAGIRQLTSTATIADADPEGSAKERFEIQKTAWRIFVDHPVFGVGLGAYSVENAIYSPALGRKDTHNTYLALATELGLPGLLLWLVMIFVAFRSNIANKRLLADQDIYVARSWISRALFGFLVAGIFGSYSALNILYLVLGIMSCSTAAREN
jgi:O-antigen ligase